MVLVIDAQVAGISGDMLLSSLVGLGADGPRVEGGIRAAADLTEGAELRRVAFERTSRRGLEATRMVLDVRDDARSRTAADVRGCIAAACAAAGLPAEAAGFADSSAEALIGAEARVHGVPPESARLHEAAGFDTVADILGSAVALDDLGLLGEEAVATPVAVGGGTVEFSHGTASNPAGAVLEILRGTGLVIAGTGAGAELTTPTGACMLRCLAGRSVGFYPPMTVGSVSYGAGDRDHPGFPNVLKLVRGGAGGAYGSDEVAVLETNLDDVPGEVVGRMVGSMMDRGARDVTVSPALAKKGRPAHLVSVICDPASADGLARALIAETGTLGVRVSTASRVLARRSSSRERVEVAGREFEVGVKSGPGGRRPESDDVAAVAAALGVPYREAARMVGAALGPGGG